MFTINIYLWYFTAMHVTLRQLQVFEAVARHLSYTRAAEELHLTQPAVSIQVRQLEESIELPLFEQIGKKVFLTEAGEELQHYSRGIAEQLAEAEAVIDELKGLHRGRLKISVATTANYFVPNLLAAFNNRYQGVNIVLDVTNRSGLLKQLEFNETDIVIMGRPPAGHDLEFESFRDNPLVIVAPPDHALARRQRIPLSKLHDQTFLVREPGSGTRIAMERFFAERGLEVKTGMEVGSNEAIKQSVQAGLGLGLLSRDTLAMELQLKQLTILNVEGFPIMRSWYVVHRRGKRLSAIARAFKNFLLSETPRRNTAVK
jgi:DNA-binding transcriptional LysR family regulator